MGRLTKKFFRDEIVKSRKIAYSLLPTILKRYGKETKISPRKSYYKMYLTGDDQIEGYNRGVSWWVTGFCLHADKSISLMVYWQGDSTDGDEYIELPSDIYKSAYLAPTQPINMGSYYCIARQGIIVRPEEIYDAIKNLKF